MAKLNIEIEIDFIDEEMNLEESVKDQIFSNIENRVVSVIKDKLTKEAEQRLSDKIDDLTMSAVTDRIEKFLIQPITITDKYGDVIQENITIDMMLKEKIGSALEKKTLDENGKSTKSSYNTRYSIFDFLCMKNVSKMVEEQVEKLATQTKKEIETLVKDKIKMSVAENLTDFILKNGKNPLIKK